MVNWARNWSQASPGRAAGPAWPAGLAWPPGGLPLAGLAGDLRGRERAPAATGPPPAPITAGGLFGIGFLCIRRRSPPDSSDDSELGTG